MGGCCTSSTLLRLISNGGFHISEHGLAVLADIGNKLHYSRHVKDVGMDHLTDICFQSAHSSALAWLSWYASNKSCVPLASLFLFCLWQSRAPSHLLVGGLERQLRGHILGSHLWRWLGSRQQQGSDLWLAYLESSSSIVSVALSVVWVPDCGPLHASPFGVAGVPMSQWETIPWISCSLDTKRKK